jgi:hypothetical protein
MKNDNAMKTKAKKFDAVKMVRDIRDTMGEKYFNNINLLHKDLEKIRKKYHLKHKTRQVA